ncbi:hypothetical protein J6590_079913 [Homalodisca vitripennis]|nr:hypothetical protein J6590_079913 [Homalodisca vitripennis]
MVEDTLFRVRITKTFHKDYSDPCGHVLRMVKISVDFEYFDEDHIWSLCSQLFHRSAKFEDFHSHVLTHFSDEDGDLHSIISNNYHVVTRDNNINE